MSESILEQLRERRRQQAASKTIDLPNPALEGVVGRYRVIDPLVEGKELRERVLSQFTEDDARQYYLFADTLIAACVGLYLRTENGLEPIDPDGKGPACYDNRLAESLGIEASSSREVLEALFGDNRAAIQGHAATLAQWMTSPATFRLGEA
jgi:hypothetical protein